MTNLKLQYCDKRDWTDIDYVEALDMVYMEVAPLDRIYRVNGSLHWTTRTWFASMHQQGARKIVAEDATLPNPSEWLDFELGVFRWAKNEFPQKRGYSVRPNEKHEARSIYSPKPDVSIFLNDEVVRVIECKHVEKIETAYALQILNYVALLECSGMIVTPKGATATKAAASIIRLAGIDRFEAK